MDRYLGITIHLDTNRIDGRGTNPHVKQLRIWDKNRVISLHLCETVFKEATADKNPDRVKAAIGHLITVPFRETSDENEWYEKIKKILFPNGVKPETNLNDVEILFTAKKYSAWLVTNDGASKRQPGGILGNREALLNDLGIKVLRDDEAIVEIRKKIIGRDNAAKRLAERGFASLPDWVDKDLI